MKEISSREIHFTRDHVKEFCSREIGSIDFTGVITPREMSVNHHYLRGHARVRYCLGEVSVSGTH